MKYLKGINEYFSSQDENPFEHEFIKDEEEVIDDEMDYDEEEDEEEDEDHEDVEWGDESQTLETFNSFNEKMNPGFKAYLDKQKAKKDGKSTDKKDDKKDEKSDKKDEKSDKKEVKGLTAKQKKLPEALQKSILSKKK